MLADAHQGWLERRSFRTSPGGYPGVVKDSDIDTENPEPSPHASPPYEEFPSDTGLAADDEAAEVHDDEAPGKVVE